MTRLKKHFPKDTSGKLFSYLYARYKLETDRELSAKTGIPCQIISKIRNGKQGVSNSNLVSINKTTNVSIKKMLELIEGKEV